MRHPHCSVLLGFIFLSESDMEGEQESAGDSGEEGDSEESEEEEGSESEGVISNKDNQTENTTNDSGKSSIIVKYWKMSKN